MKFTKTRSDEQRTTAICLELTDEEVALAQGQMSRFERKRLTELVRSDKTSENLQAIKLIVIKLEDIHRRAEQASQNQELAQQTAAILETARSNIHDQLT